MAPEEILFRWVPKCEIDVFQYYTFRLSFHLLLPVRNAHPDPYIRNRIRIHKVVKYIIHMIQL